MVSCGRPWKKAKIVNEQKQKDPDDGCTLDIVYGIAQGVENLRITEANEKVDNPRVSERTC